MTNLPISSNQPQSSGKAANAMPANIIADSLAMDAQPSEPFAFLLARQIGGTDLSLSDSAQTAITIDGNAVDSSADMLLKDAQDEAAATANMSDQANLLAAILMQLPASKDKGQTAEDRQAMPPPALNTDGRQTTKHLSLGTFMEAEGQQVMQPFSHEAKRNEKRVSPEGNQTSQLPAIDHLQSEAAKLAELPSGLAQPAPNTAQAMASPVISAATPGMLTNHMPSADAPPIITTPLGNNGWADEFSQKIRWISTQQNQVAELHLNPPNLGPLDVVLKISDNQATALFASPHGAVRDAVENALPKLREILADNGIMLGNTTISDQSPRDRSMNEFMNQGFGTAAQHEVPGLASKPADDVPAAEQTITARRHNGMVDTFA